MKQVKLEIYTPKEFIEQFVHELTNIGACKIGNYSYVSSYAKTAGTWMPEEGSNPYNGEVGKICRGEEYKLEIRCPYEKVKEAIEVVKKIHPYEEATINVIPLLNNEFNIN